jgi:hypothetical protein
MRRNKGPRDSLRACCAECPTRTRLANIAGPSSEESGVPHLFRFASYASPSEFRTSEISQRGLQPSLTPVASRPPPHPPHLYGWERSIQAVAGHCPCPPFEVVLGRNHSDT